MKIEVTTTNCTLQGIDDPKVIPMVMDALSVLDKNARYSPMYQQGRWDGYKRFFKRPENTFPIGVLPIVLDTLKEIGIVPDLINKQTNLVVNKSQVKEFIKKPLPSGIILREYQQQAVYDTLTQEYLGMPYHRGIINIATNGGKTIIAESIMYWLQTQGLLHSKQLLFLTHSKEIAYQTKKSIEQNLKCSVGLIGDGQWSEEPVTIALVPTLSKRLKDTKFKNLVKNTCAIIVDEAHHSTAKSWIKVLNTFKETPMKIGLTGTIPTEPIPRLQLYALLGTPITQISNEFLIEQGFSATPVCYFVECRKPQSDAWDYQAAYDQLIVNNDYRNSLITQITLRERMKDSNILILVERTEHGENLLKKLLPLDIGSVVFTHGSQKSEVRKQILTDLKHGDINVLISTSILDEGVDTDNLNAVIYARGMKSSRKLLQGIGRGLRKKSDGSALIFYDFLDYTYPELTEHTLQRYETMEQENFEIKKLFI